MNTVSRFTKKDIQDKFHISLATVNNWIKTGLIPAPVGGFYTKEVYQNLIHSVKEHPTKLRKRANRSFSKEVSVNYCGIKSVERKQLLVDLVNTYRESNLTVQDAVSCLARQILISNNLLEKKSDIAKLIVKLYNKKNIFENFSIPNEDDDILGAFYQSVQNIATKSKTGSFYTPAELLQNINVEPNLKVLDPCCGSGNILIHIISKQHDPSKIFAFDIDETALLICKVNLVLFFNNAFITPCVKKRDLIFCDGNNDIDERFDYIVTNPPWGSKLSKQQKDLLIKNYPELNTTEVFSVALYNAIKQLDVDGRLHFFLPESVLNVATHKNIRKFLLNLDRNIEITPLGNAFQGVQSECVILSLSKTITGKTKIILNHEDKLFIDKSDLASQDYMISYNISQKDKTILDKLYGADFITLPETTKFALGIVTGNNKKYIHETQGIDEVPIYRGKDILPYAMKSAENFIKFTPEIFQQVAPLEMYYTKKIVYRFISDKIICALDDGNLFLNSANIIISENYPMPILVSLFNSSIYSFIYQKKFKSKKVLKQHFKDFPLPILDDKTKERFLTLYAGIMQGIKKQEDVDREICKYFGLTVDEYNHIRRTVYGDCVKYWVLKNTDVYSLNFSPQHRSAETEARKGDYQKSEIYEGQVMITRDNIASIEQFEVESRALRQAIIERYEASSKV